MKFQFIDAHRTDYPVALMCRVLAVSRSGYYAWCKRPPSKRKVADDKLLVALQEAYQESKGRYGAPRIYKKLLGLKWRCSRKRVARLMRENNLVGKRPKRRKVTTKQDPSKQPAPNRLQQNFTAQRPNEVWCADITHVPTNDGSLYLAVIIDLFSRLVVGWSIRQDMSRHLVIDALVMATGHRSPSAELIHHSDRGSQYTSDDFQQALTVSKIRPSMSGVGNCYDNAPAESWFATLKVECADKVFESHAVARTTLFEYIEIFYNRQRLHSQLGYLSPVEYEKQYQEMNSVSQSCVH